jgi:hypothetical protein
MLPDAQCSAMPRRDLNTQEALRWVRWTWAPAALIVVT